jgi:tetratricopeptide (TPR) repeat protein
MTMLYLSRLAAPLALSLAFLGGCKGSSGEGPKAEPSATAASTAPAPVDADRALALSTPAGATAVDLLITQSIRTIQSLPGKADYWVVLGRFWVRKARESSDPGFYLNAEAAARVALSIQPDLRPAKDLQAIVFYNQHKFEEARALSAKIVEDGPDDPMAYGDLSDALLELGRYDEAVKSAQTMMDLKPNLPSYIRASYLQWLRGDEKAALESARQAIDSGADQRDPEPRAWALVQAAYIFWQRGDYVGADAGFLKALDQMSEYPPALVGRGRVSLAKGDGKRAAELFDRAYKQSPLVQTAWLLGDAKTMAGDTKGAADAYALVEKEGAQADKRTLAQFYATKNRSDAEVAKALTLAQEEKKTRGDIYMDDALAWALYRNKRFTEAKEAIDHALRLATPDALLRYHSGAIRIALGDKKEGAKLVADALKLNPKFDATGAPEAEKLLGDVQAAK